MVVRINEWEVKMSGGHLGMGSSAFIFQPVYVKNTGQLDVLTTLYVFN